MEKQIISIQHIYDGYIVYLGETPISAPFQRRVCADVYIKKILALNARFFAPIKGGRYEVIL